MDTFFRIKNTYTSRETYLLEDWGAVRKTSVVTAWFHDLKNGVQLGSTSSHIGFYDLANLNWSGREMANSVTPALWQSIEKDIPIYAFGNDFLEF